MRHLIVIDLDVDLDHAGECSAGHDDIVQGEMFRQCRPAAMDAAAQQEPLFDGGRAGNQPIEPRNHFVPADFCQESEIAEIDADKENRPLHDGEVRTACQQSCPTQAITFGDKNDTKSAVAKQKKSPLDYVLLDDLNTRPRTSYDAIVRNPNPAIKDTPS